MAEDWIKMRTNIDADQRAGTQCGIEAIPTEWKGVRYRSKCEAMFAVWLHNNAINANRAIQNYGHTFQVGFDFQYEPQSLVIGRWAPDFFVARVFLDFLKQEVFPKTSYAYEVIEYKPSEPTRTYVDCFKERCARLHQKLFLEKWVTYSIYYGSPYGSKPSALITWCSTDPESGWQTRKGWLQPEFAKTLLNYRFDLK